MTKPSDSYLWDTDKTNTVTSTSGHKTDGYAIGEVPTSGEINYLFGSWSDWIDWLQALFGTDGHLIRGTRVRHIPLAMGFQTAGTAMSIDTTNDSLVPTSTNNVFRIPIIVDQGEEITLVQSRVQMANAGSVSVLKVYKDDLTGSTPSRSQLGSTATSTGSTDVLETLSSGALTETATSGFVQYFAEYTITALAGGGSNLFGLFVTTTVP